MKIIKLHLYILLASLMLVSSVFAGGGSRNGTAGASQLLLPVGTRGIAMGGATLTNATGLDALYYNPANLAKAEHNTNVFFSHMSHIADIGVSYGAVSFSLEGLGSLALGIKTLEFDEIDVTTVESPDGTGATFTPQMLTIGLTYSKMLSDRIAVGLTANYISETLDQASATGIAFNVGVSYENLGNIQGLSVAVVLKNLGPQMTYDGSGLYINADAPELNRPEQYYKIESASFELPSTFELGLGYNFDFDQQNNLQFSSVFQSTNFYGDEYRLGAEYSYDNLFFVRGGYTLLPELEDDENTYGLSAGVGLNYDLGGVAFQVDYAYREVEFFDDNHIFSIGLGL